MLQIGCFIGIVKGLNWTNTHLIFNLISFILPRIMLCAIVIDKKSFKHQIYNMPYFTIVGHSKIEIPTD